MTTKTTITITFEGDDAQAVVDLTRGVDLTLLLRESLGEFAARRQPVAQYVATRYEAQDDRFRARKLREVGKRCELAAVLRRGDVTIYERVDPTPEAT